MKLNIVPADLIEPMNTPPHLSVVAPCYNEQESLREFWSRTHQACFAAVKTHYEIILVDDGSTDGSWEIIDALAEQDPCVVGVRLLRNHGHQLAVTAGLSVSRGTRILVIDADLQDPPELISDMMRLMDRGADVVYGKRAARAGESRFKLLTAKSFYRVLAKLTDVPIPRDTGDFRLMTRRIVDILNGMPERHRFIRGMVSWIGGRQVAIEYDREPRFAGQTKYPLAKMLRFATDAVTSFSIVPLRVSVWLGLTISIGAFGLLVYVILAWCFGRTVPGWASSLSSTALFSGIQLLMLGVIGEYLGRLVEAQKNRPLFMIDCIRQGVRLEAEPAGHIS